MTKVELLKEVKNIPGDEGWWNLHCSTAFQEVALELWVFGFPDKRIIEILTRLYLVTSEEFGA